MKKLIPMTDYVLEQSKICQFKDDCKFAYSVRSYANFLKLPLTLGMFIPTDENGNVLKEPPHYNEWIKYGANAIGLYSLAEAEFCYKFQIAKEPLIFDGFVLDREQDGTFLVCDKFHFDVSIIEYSTIEDFCWQNLDLTETAVKKYGL